jgi:hypothetical protein
MNEKTIFEESKPIDIMNIPEIIEWMNPEIINKDVFEDKNLILKNNKVDFIKKFGKQTFCTMDSSRRRLYVWKIAINTETTMWVITAPERGTSIEYITTSQNFIEPLKNKIREIFSLKVL